VISCGTYSVDAVQTQVTVNLGYEPQWLLIKRATGGTGAWYLFDNMRGITTGGDDAQLQAQSTGSEAALGDVDAISLTSTGFQTGTNATVLQPSSDYIYIAIRRGPMKVPTDATKVFTPVLGRSTNPNYLSGFPVDLGISEYRVNGSNSIASRLQGSNIMDTASTAVEASDGSTVWTFMDGYYTGGRTTDFVSWMFRRAPSFFDVVCWSNTTNSGNDRISHNLGVPPELIITKQRNVDASWYVYNAPQGRAYWLRLNAVSESTSTNANAWGTSNPTATDFGIASSYFFGAGAKNHIAYLFASCPGVSKVGSYTGTAATKQIDCDFTAGARFVLIKRTDSTGAWYVWDTARGIIAGNDPYLLLNSTAAEVTNTDYIDSYSAGFELSSTAPADLNASGGTFIFLAIA
jgi:hypothetical protein